MTTSKAYLKSAWIVSVCTLLSRILGLARDVCMASLFGAGMILDGFVLAFTIPNLFRRFFGEGALTSAFLPVFSEEFSHRGEAAAWKLASKTMSWLVITLLFLVVTGIIICVSGMHLGNISAKTHLALGLMATMMPYLLLICLTAFLGAVLNARQHFLVPALAPVILNLCWLAGIFILAPLFGSTYQHWIYAIAVAIVIGGLLQVAIQWPALRRHQAHLSIDCDFRDPSLRKTLNNLGPVILGAAAVQINVLVDRLIAWLMIPGDGALTVLYMANRLMQFPLAIIGISMATVVFPLFTQYAVNRDRQFTFAVTEALRLSFYLALPAAVGMMLLADPLVRLIYQYRRFSAAAADRTVLVLLAYASGLWLYILLQIVLKAFYSLGDTRTPTRVAIGTVVGNLTLNLLLVPFWAEAGLALATAINALGHFAILLYLLQKQARLHWQGLGIFVVKTGLAVAIMGVSVWAISHYCGSPEKLAGRVTAVLFPVLTGIIVYFLISLSLNIQEFTQFLPRKKNNIDAKEPKLKGESDG